MTSLSIQPRPAHPAHAPSAQTPHEKLVQQTQKWVAQSFYGTLLKQLRNDPFRDKLLDGGRGGQVFGQMFDQQLADRMSRGAAPKLVNSIVRKIEGSAAAASYLRQSKQNDAATDRIVHPRPLGADAAANARIYDASSR